MSQAVAYNGAYIVGLGPIITEEMVLDIIHSHQGFRANYPEEELMDDEQFLRRYNEIIEVPERGVVNGEKAGEIEYLRALYEKLPLRENARYNRETVRLQTASGKFKPVPSDEVRKIFAGRISRINWYWVRDILDVELGRWGPSVGGGKTSEPRKKRKYERKRNDAAHATTTA